MADDRVLEEGLGRLGRLRAPSGLLPGVLRQLGLGYWYGRTNSVLGPLFVAQGPAGVVAVCPAGEPEEFERWFEDRHGRAVRPVEALPGGTAARLEAALRGERSRLAVDLGELSEFQRSVLLKAREIPRGEVRTYGWIAKEIGRPRAVRAVGTALARNPVPLIVPCHRVLPGDLRVGEYSCGGPEAKRAVLRQEGIDPDELETLATRGVRYVGSDTTRIFCTPTCHRAQRITEAHLVPFRAERDAREAGYRPCRVCRPVVEAAA
jgi:O-6-methylguanine DNA methyltransferase